MHCLIVFPFFLKYLTNTKYIAVNKYIDITFIIYAGVYFGWADVWVFEPRMT
jgi:hypothetical protein